MNEQELIQESIAYLKRHYGEDTIRMVITESNVANGTGVLQVECTVSIDGVQSDWTKWFTFKNGSATAMRWEPR